MGVSQISQFTASLCQRMRSGADLTGESRCATVFLPARCCLCWLIFCQLLLVPCALLASIDDQAASFERRWQSIRLIEPPFSAAERARMYAVLEALPSQEALSEMDLATLKNDVADKLLEENPVTIETAQQLTNSLKTPAYGDIWQDYCLQKIPDLIEHLPLALEPSDLVALLEQQVVSGDGSLAGTALISLLRIHRLSPELLAQAQLSKRVHSILEDQAMPVPCQITALLVGAEVQAPLAHARAHRILQAPDAPTMLKVAALSTLARFADSKDQALILSYTESKDNRLRRVAQTAYQTFKN